METLGLFPVALGETEGLWFMSNGWATYSRPGREAWVHVTEGPNGRLLVDSLFSAPTSATPDGSPETLTTDILRTIPISRIEAALSVPDVADEVRRRIAHESEVASDVIEALHLAVREYTEAMERLTDEWVEELPSPRSLLLDVPEGRRKPDDFYRHVAAAYAAWAAVSNRPALDIADANGVPVTTVHRWVKEARRRHIMPPARPGG